MDKQVKARILNPAGSHRRDKSQPYGLEELVCQEYSTVLNSAPGTGGGPVSCEVEEWEALDPALQGLFLEKRYDVVMVDKAIQHTTLSKPSKVEALSHYFGSAGVRQHDSLKTGSVRQYIRSNNNDLTVKLKQALAQTPPEEDTEDAVDPDEARRKLLIEEQLKIVYNNEQRAKQVYSHN